MPKKLVIWYFLAQIFRFSAIRPGRLGSTIHMVCSVQIAGKFFYALAAVIVIELHTPWTNFSTLLMAPSHPGTSGPLLPRRSVIRRMRLSKIFARCLPVRLRATTKNNDDNEQQRRTTTTTNNDDDKQLRRQR